MKIARKIAILIILVIIILIPSLKMITHIYYTFSSFFTVLVLSVCILLLPIPIVPKISIVLVILAIYQNNIRMSGAVFMNAFKFGYLKPLETRKDNSELRAFVNRLFKEHFNLITNFDKFPSQPSLVLANYCKDRLENVSCLLLPGKMAIMMRDGLTILKLHKMVKWSLFTEASGNYEKTKSSIMGHVLQGHHVFSYVTTKTSLRPDLFVKIRSGMFSIAKELNVPVTPVVFDYIDITPCGHIPRQNYEIRVGDTFYVENVQKSMREVIKFYRESMAEFMKTKYKGIKQGVINE